MHSRPEARRFLGWLRALVLLLGLVAVAGAPVRAAEMPANWSTTIDAARATVADENATTPALEAQRDTLLRLRSAALEAEPAAAAALAQLTARLESLGPAPEEGIVEPVELRQRREALNAEIAAAQLPLVDAQEASRQSDALIREVDAIVRARFLAELRNLGPSPLRPKNWIETLRVVGQELTALESGARALAADPVRRGAILKRLPLSLLLVMVGTAITFSLRRWLTRWTESDLGKAQSPRRIAWLIALRNASRLIVPLVGVGLLFGAIHPESLLSFAEGPRLFHLPGFVIALIGAGWLGNSVFSPRLAAYRLVPLPDHLARRGARLTLILGGVLAAHLFISYYLADREFSPVVVATLSFPIILLGGVALWPLSRLLRGIRLSADEAERSRSINEDGPSIGIRLLGFLEQGLAVVAVLAPILAGIGYFAAATHLLFPAILTVGLLGTCHVLFDLTQKSLHTFASGPAPGRADGIQDGLLPVIVVAVLSLAAAPLLALIWGMRPAELASVWILLRDGVTWGGFRISLGLIVTFAVVFGIGLALTRVLQSLLRNSVLPRTRMDAGGKNAVLAGIGYLGFFIAALAGISSTGLDLSSIAIVAGALSVGIGFGLQNIVSNFVSGIILLVERPIKEGDWIEVGAFSGYVRGISVRSTEIETFDKASVILPNSDLVAGAVLNRTHTGMSGRLIVPVSVSHDSDPRHVEGVLLGIAEEHPLVLEDPTPAVLFIGFGPDSLRFEIRCRLRDVNFSLTVQSEMNFEIVERFRAEGITITPPPREVFVRDESRVALLPAIRSKAAKEA